MTRILARFKGPLLAPNLLWVTVFLAVAALVVVAVPARIQVLSQDPYGLGPALEELGLSLQAFSVYAALFNGLVMAAFLLTGALVFWGKPGDRAAVFASLALLLMGVSLVPLIPSLYQVHPNMFLPIQVFRLAGLVMTLNLMYTFPTGRFVPTWTRFSPPAALLSGLLLLWPGWEPPTVFLEFDRTLDYLAFAILVAWFATGAYAQITRYRKVSTAVERQQTKWVMLGFIMTVIVFFAEFLARVLFPALRSGRGLALYTLVEIPLSLFALLFVPLSVTFSIFRYRLWDIDLIIRRTLIYSLLSGSLALVYFLSVVLLQQVFPSQSPVAIVLSTLAIAGLFNPLRGRIQKAIDKRFYRRKYDAQQILSEFSRSVQDVVDLDELTAELVSVIEEILQPEEVSLWLTSGWRPTSGQIAAAENRRPGEAAGPV